MKILPLMRGSRATDSPSALKLAGLLTGSVQRTAACALLTLVLPLALTAQTVNFSREILPLLSDKCFSCHGADPSTRMAGLRLDTREEATKPRRGKAAVMPGKPEDSLIMARIAPANPNSIMPPERSHKAPLTAEQVATFRRWIEQGAAWGKHWSFEKPERGAGASIDEFISQRLTREGLRMSPAASRETLIRRVSFDLTGLPPTPEAVAAFVADQSPDAWKKVVASLLASEHFGERMAMWWLDAAHYADTDGFQADSNRTNWPWRDWVVNAFNKNQRFDQFTIEQFAGDLLPNATPEQKLATGFFRSHMTNGEGGRDPEESRIDYVMDRVNTTGTVWLGLTTGCAQCHTHKFDPITHNEYYSLSGFFNSIDEDGHAGPGKSKPYLKYSSPYAARAIAEAKQLVDSRKPAEAAARSSAEKPFALWLAAQTKEVQRGFRAWRNLRVTGLESAEGTKLTQQSDGAIQAGGPNPVQDDYRISATLPLRAVTGLKLEVLPYEGHLSRGKSGEFLLTDVKLQVRKKGNSQLRDITFRKATADFNADTKKHGGYGNITDTLDDDPRNGWTTIGSAQSAVHTGVYALAEPLTLAPDEEILFEMRHRSTTGDANIARFQLYVTDQPGPAVESVDTAPLEQLAWLKAGEVTPEPLRQKLFEQFLTTWQPYLAAKEMLDRATRQYDEVKAADAVNVMVLAERPAPRETNVLLRGVWDKKGEKVEPGIIAAIAPWPAAGYPEDKRDRLGLAHWIVSRQNPLTARVIVNDLWQIMFGAGLVRTPEDFGLQGEHPTHPELLDWLAVEFMESGWDVKHMLTLMAESQAYRQRSEVSPELQARDPQNLLLAHGPRYRLASWMLRDAALQYAGVLNPAIGGPPVKPYQPEGVWEELFMGRFKYEASEGPAQYRRSLYAFWRRSIAPTFLFDTAQRRACEVRISRTNTPLQALTLMNDATYLEASRTLAEQALSLPAPQRAAAVFQRVLGRKPDSKEATVLQREYDRVLQYYRKSSADAGLLVKVGQSSSKASSPELAAWMVISGMILNLDEAMTHE